MKMTAPALAFVFLGIGAPVHPQDAEAGAQLHARYCASCHGSAARGDGPMRAVLTPDPPDLTVLAARNGGRFPTARVVGRIDGRDPLVAHGSEMPIYGDVFNTHDTPITTERGDTLITGGAVVDLVAFLQHLQRNPD